MGGARSKLHSRRGASLLLALGVCLIFFLVGSVVLGSATASASRLKGRRTQEQAYLSLSSAARLLQETLAGSECSGWTSRTEYTCGWEADTAGRCGGLTGDDNFLTDAAWPVFCGRTGAGDYTVSAGHMDEVHVALEMDETYRAVLTLTTDSSDYVMTLTFEATLTHSEARETSFCSHETTEVNEQGEEVWVTETYDVYTITDTTVIAWDGGTIAKGGAGRG
ncbi:hypothetical protein KQI82_11560 [Oscillibacter sp. MSJ-2]|uniref:Type 4 fimbrial biogenesis protein PilX N-terminal domain-containing protein n=1 Tax=Dysosmobacter acutus TaxID=2841504 RepID=A0ABS6FDA0_9FIRM|nr:hypothetical protein [Dysosmobacter acutus]MBU5627547.1 hypothetical protein [Dysosmobacter acutus]